MERRSACLKADDAQSHKDKKNRRKGKKGKGVDLQAVQVLD